MKKFARFLAIALVVCMLPVLAFAKTYDAWDIYNGEIDKSSVVLTKGDKLKGYSNVSVDVVYADASGNTVQEGNKTIAAVKIGDETVTEWAISSISGSVITIGSRVNASLVYKLVPSYAVADAEGYYTLSTKTYEAFSTVEGKKVKATGTVELADETVTVVAIAEGVYVILDSDQAFTPGDRVAFKGAISGSSDYNGETFARVAATEATVQTYDPLQKGDTGEAVTEMKLRLQELGYFNAGASLSDQYNDTCVERVKQFQEKNGLDATGEAAVDTLNLLFSDAAVAK